MRARCFGGGNQEALRWHGLWVGIGLCPLAPGCNLGDAAGAFLDIDATIIDVVLARIAKSTVVLNVDRGNVMRHLLRAVSSVNSVLTLGSRPVVAAGTDQCT